MRKKEEPIGYVGKQLTNHLYLSELTLLSIWQTKERNLVQWWRSQNSCRHARLTCDHTSNPRFSFFNYIELGNSSSLYYRFMLLLTNCFIKTWKELTFGLCATQEFKTLYFFFLWENWKWCFFLFIILLLLLLILLLLLLLLLFFFFFLVCVALEL